MQQCSNVAMYNLIISKNTILVYKFFLKEAKPLRFFKRIVEVRPLNHKLKYKKITLFRIIFFVDQTGLEPATSSVQARRSTR